jgi:hypothetical protein
MDDLRKDETLNIRMTAKQKAKIRRAARVESRRREKIVEPGPLLLELAMSGIERILAGELAERRRTPAFAER